MTVTMYFLYRKLLVITTVGSASLGETFISGITQHANDGYYRNLLPYRIIFSSENTSNSATIKGGQPTDDKDATCSTHGTRRAEILTTTP